MSVGRWVPPLSLGVWPGLKKGSQRSDAEEVRHVYPERALGQSGMRKRSYARSDSSTCHSTRSSSELTSSRLSIHMIWLFWTNARSVKSKLALHLHACYSKEKWGDNLVNVFVFFSCIYSKWLFFMNSLKTHMLLQQSEFCGGKWCYLSCGGSICGCTLHFVAFSCVCFCFDRIEIDPLSFCQSLMGVLIGFSFLEETCDVFRAAKSELASLLNLCLHRFRWFLVKVGSFHRLMRTKAVLL